MEKTIRMASTARQSPVAHVDPKAAAAGLGTTLLFRPSADSEEVRRELRVVESMESATTLYKYLARRHAEGLITEGSTRVGTLFDFRREELGRGVADPDEGKLRVDRSIVGELKIDRGTPSAEMMRFFGVDVVGSASIENIHFRREIEHPDVFVWCCSTVHSKETMSSLEGADTCVEIRNAGAFFDELTAALNAVRPVEFLGFREVTYVPRDQTWESYSPLMSAAFVKEPAAYGAQNEVRAVWRALDENRLEPAFPQSRRLAEFCSIKD
ncbi:hypothetical protein [Paraburkholderia sp. XV]|uniref:hypothetical protein n=1 Tax=Paraburkholderia sp. XV TaxID=2831520 RepID=UPI001CD2C019|nr:hypothetical protein [Paraburkholderia sp. XV]